MPAVPPHDSQVIDEAWDATAEVAKLSTPITKATGTGEFAWYDPAGADTDGDDGYPDAKSDWKFPHHKVAGDGRPGAANVRALRNGLSRLSQADIPDGDREGVRKHLQHHLDAFKSKSTSPAAEPVAQGTHMLWATPLMGKCLALRAEVVSLLAGALEAGVQPTSIKADAGPADAPGPGIIPLYGLITPHGSFLSMLLGLGGGGLDTFRAQLDAAVQDDTISHIVLDIDSPGGLVDLVPETAAEIRQARDVKPITAVANCDACSAAYWLAAQATEVVATPSALIGSIGVYQMHQDVSGALEAEGIQTTLISAGKYKIERHPLKPLGSDARQALQNTVDQVYGWFASDVAAGRGVQESSVRNGFGEGRVLLADDAVKAGLADRVATLEQVVSGFANAGGDPAPQPTATATAEANQERFRALEQIGAV